MNEKIEVKKIVIQMGDKEAELTIEQARELKDALVDLLGKKETVYLSSQPVIIERPYYPYYPPARPYWAVTYGDNTSTVTYSLNQ